MQSLRDKLLKAGLVSEDQAKKSESEAAQPKARPERLERAERPSGGGGGRHGETRRAESHRPEPRRPEPRRFERPERAAPIPKLPPLAVPNNKEFQRFEAKKQVETDRQMRELVVSTQVTVEPGEHTFYFVTRKNRLRRMEMTPDLAHRLESGELAVVERPEPAQIEHSVVPAETALKLMELSPRAVRFFNRSEQPIGFLSDDELNRRQKVEAERAESAESGASEETDEPAATEGAATPAAVTDEPTGSEQA
jgi:uncharacterized protein YaiL (DUF2058 family)